jgi:uncharacterized protein DUF4926
MIKELETIVLSRNLPEYGLSRGDIGAVVHSYKSGESYEVEFVNGRGKTIALITLKTKDVRPMNPNEILHVREIRAA